MNCIHRLAILTLCPALLLAAFAARSRAVDSYYPANFLTEPAQVFDADMRLEMLGCGTIELWLSAPKELTGKGWLPVVTHGDKASGFSWQMAIDADRKSVALRFPQAGMLAQATCDFTDGKFHHVAAIVREGDVVFVVDGKQQGMAVLMERPTTDEEQVRGANFAQPIWPGRPLTVGGGGAGPGFGGWIYSLRIWKGTLSLAELDWTRGFYGLPEIDAKGPPGFQPDTRLGYQRDDRLAAYGHFTLGQQKMVYPQPAIQITNISGSTAGKPFFVPVNAHGYGIATLEIQFADAGITGLLARINGIDAVSSYLPERPRPLNVRREINAARRLAASINLDGEVKQEAQEHHKKVFDLENLAGIKLESDLKTGATFDSGVQVSRMQLGVEGTSPQRLVGTYHNEVIRDLAIGTNLNGNLRRATGFKDTFFYQPFCQTIPADAVFAGLVGRMHDDGRLAAIGMAYTFPAAKRQQELVELLRFGRWVERDAGVPVLDNPLAVLDRQIRVLNVQLDKFNGSLTPESGALAQAWKRLNVRRDEVAAGDDLAGTYNGQVVYRFHYLPAPLAANDRLELVVDDYCVDGDDAPTPGQSEGATSTAPRVHRFRWLGGNDWITETGANQPRLLITERGVKIFGGTEAKPDPSVVTVLVPATPYEIGNRQDKISWGGTFNLEQRPMLAKANFRGYNPLRMDPRDYQYSGCDKFIFRYPAEDSHDYYFADGKMIVPFGLHYRSDNQGREESNTQTLSSSSQHQEEWTASLGMNMSIPLVASFSMNGSYGQQMSQMNSQKTVCTLTRTRETRYALILDRAQMDLDPEFVDRIEELRDTLLAGGKPNFVQFFEAHGTHYPHAITYGGMAWLEMFLLEQEHETMFGQSSSIHVSGDAAFEGIGGGASAGLDKKSSDTLKQMVGNQRANFGTYGGSLSKGEGWTLGRGEEVPLLLDLRPIHELLSPTWFDDPKIWGELRSSMQAEFDRYTNRQPNFTSGAATPTWYKGSSK